MEQKYIAGDCVRYVGIATPRVVKIDEVREGYLILRLTKGNRSWSLAYYREIEPVPITTEILTYNGWKWSDEHEEFAKHGVSIYPVGNYYRTDIFNMEIRYVHQLQHLLFGLGLNSDMKI